MHKIITIMGLILLGLLMIIIGGWGTLAIVYAESYNEMLRYGFAIGFGLASLSSVILLWSRRLRWRALSAYSLLFMLLLLWYGTITPSNDRQWQEDVALLPYTTQKDNLITVYNIRNFDYRSETDYTPAYYDKTFDLDKLEGVDIISVYWMGPAVAHVFLSFAFAGDEHLAVSIETRKEKGESYSALKGFFRQYELYYVVADERDVIRLRTNYRLDPPEDVYVYPTSGTIGDARRLFLAYIEKINALKNTPEFYNTLTTNCTTTIWLNAHVNTDRIPLSWKILASGYVPEYLYENGRLHAGELSFSQLRESVHINERAHEAGMAEDFSYRIRKHPDTTVPTN
ncbi:MAG: DUF4105 domain-containing protein [Sulfurimonadaceae bacterium]